MARLYEQLVNILGKVRPESGNLLAALARELDEKPKIECSDDNLWFYDFNEHGFKLYFLVEEGQFVMLHICIATAEVCEGDIKPFPGELPYGILRTDSRELVESKLPGSTMEVKDYRFDADLRPLTVTFHFRSKHFSDPLSEELLSMVSVKFSH